MYMLGSEIGVDNVLRLLRAADLYSALELKAACFAFAVQEFGSIMVHAEYIEMAKTDGQLMQKLQKAAAKMHFNKKS